MSLNIQIPLALFIYLVDELLHFALETPPFKLDRDQFVAAHDRSTLLLPSGLVQWTASRLLRLKRDRIFIRFVILAKRKTSTSDRIA